MPMNSIKYTDQVGTGAHSHGDAIIDVSCNFNLTPLSLSCAMSHTHCLMFGGINKWCKKNEHIKKCALLFVCIIIRVYFNKNNNYCVCVCVDHY